MRDDGRATRKIVRESWKIVWTRPDGVELVAPNPTSVIWVRGRRGMSVNTGQPLGLHIVRLVDHTQCGGPTEDLIILGILRTS